MRASRAAVLAAAVAVAVVGVVTAREIATARAEVVAADAASQRSDWADAIVHARAAAEAVAPGNPWPDRGRQRLEAIGHDAEARGDDPTALLAYGAMRAAALATRAPGTGSELWRQRAEEGLARVASARRDVASPQANAGAMLDALRDNEPPATWTLVALAASALAMLGAMARLAWLGDAARSAHVAQAIAGAGLLGYAIVALTQ
jgi:hypothetical protein